MNKPLTTFLIPPLAVCRYGCASCCAAPIGVFWITGLISIVYGFLGGPAHLAGTSWPTVGLGAGLWLIAMVWAWLVIRNTDEETCEGRPNRLCRTLAPDADETDPLDEVRKAAGGK